MKMGKGIVLAGILLTLFLNGCTGGGKNDKIVVVSREDGSGKFTIGTVILPCWACRKAATTS